jgi:hypothetical protein
MQLNIVLGSGVHGTLSAINGVTGFVPMNAGDSQSVQFPVTDITSWSLLQFYWTSVASTGSTITFTDSYGHTYTQQINQLAGTIRRSGAYNRGTLVAGGAETGGGNYFAEMNPYINQTGVDITEIQSSSGALVVEFFSCAFDPNGTINVSIT